MADKKRGRAKGVTLPDDLYSFVEGRMKILNASYSYVIREIIRDAFLAERKKLDSGNGSI